MRAILRRAVAIAVLMAAMPPPVLSAAESNASIDAVIENVNVLPMTAAGSVETDTRVVIRNGRIESIGKNGGALKSLRRIDAAGKWLMPALADMHVHPDNDRMLRMLTGNPALPYGTVDDADVFAPYVVNGVLQIMNMAAMSEAIGQRTAVESGRILGPHMALAAMVDGSPPIWPSGISHVAVTPEDGRQLVRDMKADGFDFIKTYSRLTLDTFTAIVDEARIQNMKALGHIPGRELGMTEKFFQPNYTMVAHAEEFALQGKPAADAYCSPGRGCTAADSDIPAFVDMAKRNGTWLTATLTLDDRILQIMKDPDSLKARPDLKYLAPLTYAMWVGGARKAPPERIARQERIVEFNAKLVKAFVAAGIPVLPGTDSGVPGVAAGFALHDEMEALVRAGMTPEQVLVAATRQSAEWLGTLSDRGTVESGKRADLILLDADPRADVANTRKIAGVIVGGRYVGRAELKAILARLAKHHEAMPPRPAGAAGGPGRFDDDN
jgi:imidazolonepropionase-like amidohydrolase